MTVCSLLVVAALGAQDTLAAAGTPPLAHDLDEPFGEGVSPVAGDQDATDDVDQLDEENQEAVACLANGQHDGLNVVLDKDAGDVRVLGNLLAALGDGVLVGLDGAAAVGVDGGDDGEVVLELVEVGGGSVDGAVEGVDERRVKGAVGELGDDVGKVEGWGRQRDTQKRWGIETYQCDQDAGQTPCSRGRGR